MDICRLCFATQSHHINIFDEFELNLNVAEIINEHIGEVSVSDALPKTVCIECWNKTENFHKFHRSVKSAQNDYLQKLVKFELADDLDVSETFGKACDDINLQHFVEVIQSDHDLENVHEIVFTTIKCDVLNDLQTKDANPFNVEDLEINCALESANNISEVLIKDTRTSVDGNPFMDVGNQLKRDFDDDNNAFDNDSSSGCESVESRGILNASSSKVFNIIAQNFDFSCDVCQIDLKTLKRAIIHYKKEHDIADGYIKCCGLKFKRQQLVDEHIHWHQNPEIFKCKQCNKCMKTKSSLSKHLTHHKNLNTFICDLCGKMYSYKDKLKRHMITTHINSFECKMCTTRCSNKQSLEVHERLCHNPDMAGDIRRKLDELKEIYATGLSAPEADEIISKYFDMTCDICGDVLKSLQHAQFHYMHDHQVPHGYIKCCGIKFDKNHAVNGHIYWHKDPDIFKCDVCGKVDKTMKSFRLHLRDHSMRLEPNQNICVKCNKKFSRKDHLTRHMKNVHGTGAVNISGKITLPSNNTDATQPELSVNECFDMTCDICSVTLDSLQHAKLHYLDEHGIVNGYIKCCDSKFKEVSQIDDHLKYHLNPDIFKCHICDKNFPRKDRLLMHLHQHKAIESKRYACGVCNKVFKSKYCLNLHEKTHEQSSKVIPCGLCNRRFTTEKLRKSHEQRIHQKSEKMKAEICEFCARPFSTRKDVLSHIRSMHSDNPMPRERFQCEVCNAWLGNRYTLKEHMDRHTSEPQKCPQCDKVSPNQYALTTHIRDVHTERIHKCHLCDKSFKAAVALKDHVATHTGEKLYKCLYCPESFIWRPNCYSHQKKAHPREWSDDQLKKSKAKSL